MELMHKFKIHEQDTSKEVVFFGAEGAQDWAVCCWDLRSKTIKTSYKGNSSKARTLNLINGEYVISADSCKPLLHIWALNKRDLYLRITCGGLVTALAVTSDGAYCAAAISMTISIWQVSTGELMASFETSQVNYLQFARNSKYLLSAESSTVRVWPFAKILSNPKERVECIYKFMHDNSVSGIKCGSASVFTSADRVVTLWSLRNGNKIRNVWLESAVSALEWGPKEDRAFAGTYEGDIYEIDTQNEKESPMKFVYVRSENKQVRGLAIKKDRRVTCLSLSLDGRILITGSLKGKIYLWNTHTRYLVTSIHLNVSGAITSCLVASVPPEFEKPVHPLTKFQRETKAENEGKVKILLQNQKLDLELNLDFGDDKFDKFVTKGLSLLEEFGKAANKGEQYAKNWTRLTEQLVSGLHESLDQLYSEVETDPNKFKRPPPGQVKLKPVSKEDSAKMLSALHLQFERLCGALSAMINGSGLEYPCVVEFPLKYVVELLERTMGVTPPYLLKKTSHLKTDLVSIIPFLHIAALGVLRSLMVCVKSALLPYVETVNNTLLLPGLGWSKLNASEQLVYSELRCHIYDAVQTSTIYGLSGDSKSYESFFQTVICDAATDARPLVDTNEKQEARSEQMLNRVNSYWLQVAAKRKRKSKGLMTKAKTNSESELKHEEEGLAVERLNTRALKVLKRLVASEGRFLSRSILEVIVDLLRHVYPRLSVLDSTSAVAFHELVTSVVMVVPSLPFPLELPLEVSAPRLYDDDAEEIREFYISSLCRVRKLVEEEDSSRDLASSGTFAKLLESNTKVPSLLNSTEKREISVSLNAKRKILDNEFDAEPSFPVEKRKKLDEDLGALNIPPPVVSASADPAEGVGGADNLTQAEFTENETKSDKEETRHQTKLEKDLDAVFIPTAVIRGSVEPAEEVAAHYSDKAELLQSEIESNEEETRLQEKQDEIESEATPMDTLLSCETAVTGALSTLPHNHSAVEPSFTKPTVKVNPANTSVDSEAEEAELEELVNTHHLNDQ